jgi:exonuclease SbcC
MRKSSVSGSASWQGFVDALIVELDDLGDVLAEGARLRGADVASRRAVTQQQSRHVALAAARETLGAFALAVGADPLAEGESFDARV